MVGTVDNQLDSEVIKLPFEITKNYFQKIADTRKAQKNSNRLVFFIGISLGMIVGAFFGGLTVVAMGVPLGIIAGIFIALISIVGLISLGYASENVNDQAHIQFSEADLKTASIKVSNSFIISQLNIDNSECTVFTVDPSRSFEDKKIIQVTMRHVALDIIKAEIKDLTNKKDNLTREQQNLRYAETRHIGDTQRLAGLRSKIEVLNNEITAFTEQIQMLTPLEQDLELKLKTVQVKDKIAPFTTHPIQPFALNKPPSDKKEKLKNELIVLKDRFSSPFNKSKK